MSYKIGHAISTEGRQGTTELADESLKLDMKEHTPEELYAMAYAACYSSALDAVKESRDITSKHRIEVKAGVEEDKDDKPLYVEIMVAFEDLDEKTAERIAGYGDKLCRYSTAVEGNITKTVTVIDY